MLAILSSTISNQDKQDVTKLRGLRYGTKEDERGMRNLKISHSLFVSLMRILFLMPPWRFKAQALLCWPRSVFEIPALLCTELSHPKAKLFWAGEKFFHSITRKSVSHKKSIQGFPPKLEKQQNKFQPTRINSSNVLNTLSGTLLYFPCCLHLYYNGHSPTPSVIFFVYFHT